MIRLSNMNKGSCNLCFTVDVKIFNLKDTNLQSVYERITGVKLKYESYHLCYICRVRLQQCHLLVEQILNLHKSLRGNQNKSKPLLQLVTHRCAKISICQQEEHKANGMTDIRDFLLEDVHEDQEEIRREVKQEPANCFDADEPYGTEYDEGFVTNNLENGDRIKKEVNIQLPTLRNMASSDLLLNLVLPDSITVTKTNANSDTSDAEKKFRCDICNKAFKRSTGVTVHKRTHTGDRPYTCDVCQQRFRHASHLVTHKRRHTDPRAKPYTCPLCHKRFIHSSSLLMHSKTHTTEKQFACDVCEKKFHRRHDLKTHYRIHNGDKPYSCEVCSRSFTHMSHLNTHKRTHTGVKLYSCEVCKKRFKHSSGVKKHMMTKHHGCSYILGV